MSMWLVVYVCVWLRGWLVVSACVCVSVLLVRHPLCARMVVCVRVVRLCV